MRQDRAQAITPAMKKNQGAGRVAAREQSTFSGRAAQSATSSFSRSAPGQIEQTLLDAPAPFLPSNRARLSAQQSADGVDFACGHGQAIRQKTTQRRTGRDGGRDQRFRASRPGPRQGSFATDDGIASRRRISRFAGPVRIPPCGFRPADRLSSRATDDIPVRAGMDEHVSTIRPGSSGSSKTFHAKAPSRMRSCPISCIRAGKPGCPRSIQYSTIIRIGPRSPSMRCAKVGACQCIEGARSNAAPVSSFQRQVRSRPNTAPAHAAARAEGSPLPLATSPQTALPRVMAPK